MKRFVSVLAVVALSLISRLEIGEAQTCENIFAPIHVAVEKARIQLFEAIALESGWDLLNLSKILSEGTAQEKQALAKILKPLSLADGTTSRELESTLTKLYILSNSSPMKLNLSISFAQERLVTQRIESAFLKQSFANALKDLGLIRDDTLFQKAKALRLRYSNYENLLLTLALNGVSIAHTGFPLHVPEVATGSYQKIPSEILQKIKDHGIDSAREDLRRIFSPRSNFQVVWNNIRRGYKTAMFGFAVFITVHMLPMVNMAISSLAVTPQKLSRIQDATFSAQKIREEQFLSWKKAFTELEGREPNPVKFPQDAVEWNRVWNGLARTPDIELKAKFQK